jgi:hypothetical protein
MPILAACACDACYCQRRLAELSRLEVNTAFLLLDAIWHMHAQPPQDCAMTLLFSRLTLCSLRFARPKYSPHLPFLLLLVFSLIASSLHQQQLCTELEPCAPDKFIYSSIQCNTLPQQWSHGEGGID